MSKLLSYRRHERKRFWLNLFVDMSKIVGIPFEMLKATEVNDFFYLFEDYVIRRKSEPNGSK